MHNHTLGTPFYDAKLIGDDFSGTSVLYLLSGVSKIRELLGNFVRNISTILR